MEFVPLLLLLLPAPAVSVQRLPTGAQDLRPQPLKVVVSSTCAPDGAGEREMHLDPDSPLVLTHRIRLLPGSGSGCGQCDMDFAALRERIERLEKEVSDLREKCGGPDGCCSSQQSKGSVCTTVRPETDECPDDCSDQGRCVDGKCVCFPGFSGPDCSIPDCPDDCSSRGRCVNGVCVCDPGFSGPDCSVKACPENCSNRGQCVNGRCVCDSGFAGPDCSERSCPGNCNTRGRCVNGRCVCTSGFTGPDCSSRSCPGDCSGRGQCVDGKCVCDSGFTGPDCSSQACPSDCSNKGRCVDGKCVCDSGFSGPDCSSKTCPSSCSNRGRCVRGRCVRGRCVCRRGFTGPDCSECQAGLTGENCDRALAGISGLSTRDITESSVTLSWTPTGPPYDSFHISFSSTKEAEQMVSRVGGGRSSFTQTGLAAGQQYSVSVSGERDGVMGTESTAQFSTLISGPKDLRVVKSSSTSVVVQWEPPQGRIDRYVLSVAPNQTDGSRRPDISLPPERDSARIDGLLPGRLYELSLVAERDGGRSRPASVQASPGPAPPSDLVFSDVTDRSFTVSWTKPKGKVSGFKVTHTHLQEGEPISASVDSETLRLVLSPLSPGSTYEVAVMSLLGADESEPVRDSVTTLPDAPTDLRVMNVTDSGALLLWRPALAAVDHYIIAYSSDTEAPGSGITVRVSGNTAEQQLQALRSSTQYSVSVQSRLSDRSSAAATAGFTTTGKISDGPRDLTASQVTPRTAVLSWKPPVSTITGYKLSYSTDGQESEEVAVDPAVTELKLRRLNPSSSYTARLRPDSGGPSISTQFSTGSLRFPFPSDCWQEQQNGALESGIVEVFPQGRQGAPRMVYCDMETDGGGWTVFQRRKDGKTNFFRSWREYSSGFGALDGEFWFGNELLHNFTQTPVILRVDLRAGDESVYARYSSFSVENAKKHFTIRVSGYSGTAGDSMSYHNGRPFSTRDRDPQPFITRCAMSYRGGWWYKNCHEANLNGLYNTSTNHQGVIWTAWKGKDFSIPFTEMKFRPASFRP